MHGRKAIVRSSVHPVDPGIGELRRRVAVAVARRFGSAGRPPSSAMLSTPAPYDGPVEAPGISPANEPDVEGLALDVRVRETGEW